MKKIFALFLLIAFVMPMHGQQSTFDLATYTAPAGWQKEVKETTVSYTISNKQKKSWCRIVIVKSVPTKGDIETDFASEWQTLIVDNYHPADTAQLDEVKEMSGWKIKAGVVPFTFDNAGAIAMLTTMSGHGKYLSIVALTNSQDYIPDIEKFLASIDVKKPEATEVNPASVNQPADNTDSFSLSGIWGATSTANSNYAMQNGLHEYHKRQYTFNKNGTYSYIYRSFGYLPDILISKETGTYQVSGNTITIIPKTGVNEKWSKGYIIEKDGRKSYVDKLGKLISSQERTLEKKTYQFTKHYFPGIQETNLVLSADQPTLRDGPFNGSGDFSKSWFYKNITSDVFLVKMD
jgi:hypothetical protein